MRDSGRCREEVEAEKPEIQQSAYTTLDDDGITSPSPSSSSAAAAAAATTTAYDAADVNNSISQTSVAADRALDEVVETPWVDSGLPWELNFIPHLSHTYINLWESPQNPYTHDIGELCRSQMLRATS